MPATAKLRHLRIAPRKVRLIADLVRRKSVEEAQTILNFTTKKAAQPVLKLLKQAVSNAKTGFQLEEKNLYISKILIDEGPKYKRWMPRARGMATPIYKRTSHITIILDEILKEGLRSPTGQVIKEEEKIKKSRIKAGRGAGPAPRQKEISDAGVKKTEKVSPKPIERVESAPKIERPKLKPEREEKKPIIERGIRRIFKRKAF